jgi:hypothetical protein
VYQDLSVDLFAIQADRDAFFKTDFDVYRFIGGFGG